VREVQHLGGHAPAELHWLAHKQLERPRLGESEEVGHHLGGEQSGEDVAQGGEGRSLGTQGIAGTRVNRLSVVERPVNPGREAAEACCLDYLAKAG